MSDLEVVLLRHEDDFLMNVFVMRVLGEKERVSQVVHYVEKEPIGNPPIFPICSLNILFDKEWNNFYQKHGRSVDYKTTWEEAVAHAEELTRAFASRFILRHESEHRLDTSKVILTDKISCPTGLNPNPNYRFWYSP